MSEERLSAEEVAQRRGEARLAPYLPAIHETMAEIAKRLNIDSSELVLVLPESEWADVRLEERAVMVLGCQVIHADVPAPMVACPARFRAIIGEEKP